jgi:uncharacterized protein (TIGR02646 family)
MRAIRKGQEPRSLARHRASGNANFVPDYDNYRHLDDLRQSLVAEQGAICCYCLQRIRPSQYGMKVEHWHSQSGFPNEQLNYDNLLGACRGGHGKPWDQQHCDTRKGDSLLSKNPANARHRIESSIRYINGTIESTDATLNHELNDVLNLNLSILESNRKAILDAFLQSLPKTGKLNADRLRKWIADWNGDGGGERRPYCHIVLFWLRKRLARA